MTELTTLEISAPTVEEAIAQGLAQLNLTADKVSVEVLDAGSKGLFGLGKTQVRVLLTVIPEGGMPVARTESASAEAQASTRQTQEKAAPARKAESKPEHDPLLDRTEEIVSRLINLMNLKAQVSAHYGKEDREGRRDIHVDIRGDDLSVLIGRHSETLNAFQHVASLMVGRDVQDWVQLVVDVEGFRSRRERQLVQMALRMAEQVAKTGRKQALEPMPSVERRVIHIALRDHPDVTTESTGDEPHRKIAILPKNA